MLAEIQPPHCTIIWLALRRSAIIHYTCTCSCTNAYYLFVLPFVDIYRRYFISLVDSVW